ncbi:hypothetical protein CLOM_g15602 [Closterium sp. NIES-68]|nr:hypothetical protein CLOM_g15602 [Closterium sp. NIES-68]
MVILPGGYYRQQAEEFPGVAAAAPVCLRCHTQDFDEVTSQTHTAPESGSRRVMSARRWVVSGAAAA